MAEYYYWINPDKKEYISPWDFDLGAKCYQSIDRNNDLLRALRSLMVEEWKGSRVVFLSDECPFPESGFSGHDPSGLFSDIRRGKQVNNECFVYDFISDENYTNVSGKFKAAEEFVHKEIESYLADAAGGCTYAQNEYGIDIKKPYDGLFIREGSDFRFTLNLTKKVGYSFEDVEILDQDGELWENADPLPILMGYGRNLGMGPWVGDIISFANEIDENIEILKKFTI